MHDHCFKATVYNTQMGEKIIEVRGLIVNLALVLDTLADLAKSIEYYGHLLVKSI